MPHFLSMQDWLQGLAETAENVAFGVGVLWASYRMVRFAHRQRHRYRQPPEA